MKETIFFLVFVLLFSACGPASDDSGTISTCRATVDALSALTGGLEFPAYFQTENPIKNGSEFDVMKYFSVLDHLSMQPDYVLDYVYHYDGMGGYPVLYVHPAGQPPYATEADLTASGGSPSYLAYVQIDNTPESYFQFVVLAMMGSQFYLYWHADYNDSQIVCDKAGVNGIVSSLGGDFGYRISLASRIKAALLTDIGPSVNISAQTVEVRLVTFTRWGDFYLKTYTLSRSMPHTIQNVQEKNLVPYECGVMF
jgi:hypothetical protein